MTESSKNTSLTPEAAIAMMRELLPPAKAPTSGPALLARSARGTGPPTRLDKSPGAPPRGRYLYEAVTLRQWCLDQQPAPIRNAVETAAQAQRLAVLAGRSIGNVLAEIDPKHDWAEHLMSAMARLAEIRDLFEPEEKS